jgi:hypothetical protein
MSIEFEQVVELAEQLSEEEQKALFIRLLQKPENRPLSIEERKALFASMTLDLGEVSAEYSDRREDC